MPPVPRDAPAPETDAKTCATCGRRVEWRRRWARDWAAVRHCSDACRRARPGREDEALERLILELLARRAAGATICPSEVARAHYGDDAWRPAMERVRRAARRLVARGALQITQRGAVVDPSTARGPLRLRLPPTSGS